MKQYQRIIVLFFMMLALAAQAQEAPKEIPPDKPAEKLSLPPSKAPATLDPGKDVDLKGIAPQGISEAERKRLQSLPPEELKRLKEQIEQERGPRPGGPEATAPAEGKRAEEKAAEPGKAEEMGKVEGKKEGEEEEKSVFERYLSGKVPNEVSRDLEQFGYDLFLTPTNTLTPSVNLPVPSDYIIGPDDEITVILWGRTNSQYSLKVNRDGNIFFPMIGNIPVTGFTFEDTKKIIQKQVAEKLQGTEASISMGPLRSIVVFILGNVKRPGAHPVSAYSTISHALFAAGGPTKIGTLRNIQLKHQGELMGRLDLYAFLLKGDTSNDMRLEAGDVIFVPHVGKLVGVAGNVKRPAIYEIKNNTTLEDLLKMAGGILFTGYTQRVQIERFEDNDRKIVLDLNIKNLPEDKKTELKDGDLLKVFSVVGTDVNVVYLEGNVARPGKYEFKEGMRIGDIIDEKMILPETYFDYAVIKRLIPPDMTAKIIPFNLQKAVIKKDETENLELQAQDTIVIYDKWAFEEEQFVHIEGEVRKIGKYKLLKGMKVSDLIRLAASTTKEAYLKKAEIIRTSKGRALNTIYFNVDKALQGDKDEDLPLQDEDRLIIHSLWEEKWKESISIAGEIKNAGNFILTEEMTIKDLVFKAGGPTRDTDLEEAELYRTNWRTKEVTFHKFSLKRATEDDPEHNFVLQDMDRVVIHSVWEKTHKQTVSIAGEVNKPDTYPYVTNMTVKDLIFAAGNTLESAYLEEAEISSHVIEDGRSDKVIHRTINLRLALEGDERNNLLLNPYARLFIKRIPEWREEQSVSVRGEVKFPGIYLIKKGETLKDMVERAGGFTDKAYLKGTMFTRQSSKKRQEERINSLLERLEEDTLRISTTLTGLSEKEIEGRELTLKGRKLLIDKLKTVKPAGRVIVHVEKLFSLNRKEYNVALEGSDEIYIPFKPSTVSIVGQVYNPADVLLQEGLTVADYLRMVGGPTKDADEGYITVIKANGSVQRNAGLLNSVFSQKLEPGDTIVVPEKIARLTGYDMFRSSTEALYQIAVAIAALAFIF